MTKHNFIPHVKICGLTKAEDAVRCVELGADAIGCVFYPKSPRHLTRDRAREICSAVRDSVKTVGVFVDETFSTIMRHVDYCHLTSAQLHGREPPELVYRLRKESLHVIKAVFIDGIPTIENASEYPASAFLVECGQGKLPGGNALEWNWETAKNLGNEYPLIIAGGLAPENVAKAVQMSAPDAVDVSSGVESSPGNKNFDKVTAFMEAVLSCGSKKSSKNIF